MTGLMEICIPTLHCKTRFYGAWHNRVPLRIWTQRRYDMNRRSQMQGVKLDVPLRIWTQRRYDMNRRSQMQGVKLDFAERDKCKPVLMRLLWAEHLEKPRMSLYRTEWRECGYGLSLTEYEGGGGYPITYRVHSAMEFLKVQFLLGFSA